MHNLYINQTKATAIPKTIPTQVFSPQPNIRSDDVLFKKATVPKQHNNSDPRVHENNGKLDRPLCNSSLADGKSHIDCILHTASDGTSAREI